MKCEVINPSDEVYLTGEGEALAAAGLFLGRGQYGLQDKATGKEFMPIFMFGGTDEWWTKTFGRTFSAYMDTKPHEEIAKVLDTLEYAGERSSMTDIGKNAKSNAHALRAKIKAAA